MSNDVDFKITGLIGRDEDFKLLLQVYEGTKSNDEGQLQELVLIRGHSGTGKTSLTMSLKDHVMQDEGFFLTGKFELTTLQKPYSAFIAAFDQFIDDLFRDPKQVDQTRIPVLRRAIHDAVAGDGKLLTDMIPSLERLIGKQKEGTCGVVRASEVLNRFQFVFFKFCRAISTIAPLVLFFDDLQWGDTASLDLLVALIQSGETDRSQYYPLVIGTYRDEGVDNDSRHSSTGGLPELPLHRYLDKFDELCATGAMKLTEISLKEFDDLAMVSLVARCLKQTDEESTSGLAQLIHSKSLGNPFNALQLLRLLITQGHLQRVDHHENIWTWDEDNVLKALSSAETIDQMVGHKFGSLPCLAQQVLQVAACIGDKIDFSALSTVLDQATIPEIEISLQAASVNGFLAFERQLGLYRFAHDQIRQVVLTSINAKDEFSFDIGYKLWTRSPPHFLSAKLFVVTNLLKLGLSRLTDQSQRYKAAALYLEAGVHSASLAAFADASKYLKAGIELLKGGDYWMEEYELALSLFSASADAAVGVQNFDWAAELTDAVFDHAHTVKDSLVAYRAKINSLGQRGLVKEATVVGFEALQRLGERISSTSTQLTVDAIKTKFALCWYSNEDLLSRPASEDEDKIAAVQILTTLGPYMYRSDSRGAPLVATRLVRLCLKHMHKDSALGIVTYGSMICTNDSSQGQRLGSLALSIVDKYRARELIPRVHVHFYIFIHHWKRPLKESSVFLRNAELAGMQLGDIEYAMLALGFKCFHDYCCGMSLSQLEGCLVDASQRMQLYHQHSSLHRTKTLLQYVHNLTGRALDPKILAVDPLHIHNPAVKAGDKTIPYGHHVYGADLAFMFDDLELAQQHIELRRNLAYAPHASYISVIASFKEALVCIACARRDVHQKNSIKAAKKVLRQMRIWTRHCKENFLHKERLIEAELRALRNQGRRVKLSIVDLYDQSIEGASREGFIHEAALACELCGDYLSREGESVMAATFWEKAQALYLKWGATAKVDNLRRRRELNGGAS